MVDSLEYRDVNLGDMNRSIHVARIKVADKTDGSRHYKLLLLRDRMSYTFDSSVLDDLDIRDNDTVELFFQAHDRNDTKTLNASGVTPEVFMEYSNDSKKYPGTKFVYHTNSAPGKYTLQNLLNRSQPSVSKNTKTVEDNNYLSLKRKIFSLKSGPMTLDESDIKTLVDYDDLELVEFCETLASEATIPQLQADGRDAKTIERQYKFGLARQIYLFCLLIKNGVNVKLYSSALSDGGRDLIVSRDDKMSLNIDVKSSSTSKYRIRNYPNYTHIYAFVSTNYDFLGFLPFTYVKYHMEKNNIENGKHLFLEYADFKDHLIMDLNMLFNMVSK
jgi:hypothetical protein